jgi:hypothetical protein
VKFKFKGFLRAFDFVEFISFYEKKKRNQRKFRPTSAENSSIITEINGRSDAPSLAQLTFPRRPVASLDNLRNYSGGSLKGECGFVVDFWF